MTQRRRVFLAGLAALAAYVASATVSGHLTPLAGRPLLDGFAPPPAYDWVKPPPQLAASNKPPSSGRFTVDLDPQAGSIAAVFAVADNQASLGLSQGAIAPVQGESAAILSIAPLDPASLGPPPTGTRITGNVYRFQASFRESGEPVARFRQPAQLVLFYPAPPNALSFKHEVLESVDGKTWRTLQSIDSRAQQLIQADAGSLGYFAVGESGGTTTKASPARRVLTIAVWVGGAVIVLGLIVWAEIRTRRARKDRPSGPDRRPKRRSPPTSNRIDPWE
jgi:hypothetical protein